MPSVGPKRQVKSEVMVIQRKRNGKEKPLKLTIKYRSPQPPPVLSKRRENGEKQPLVPSLPTGNGAQQPSVPPKSINGGQTDKPTTSNKGEHTWKCDKCKIFFQVRSTYYYHMNKHKILDGTGKIRCSKCEEQFVTRRDLKRHLKVHEAGTLSFLCKDCNKNFASQCHFKRHQRSHLELKKGCFKCQICTKVFSSRRVLLRHKVTFHPKRHFESFVAQICPMCPIGFLTRNSFIQHMSKHIKQENTGLPMEQPDSEEDTFYDEMPILDVEHPTPEMVDPISDELETDETPSEDVANWNELAEMSTRECSPALSEPHHLFPSARLSEHVNNLTEVANVGYGVGLNIVAGMEKDAEIMPCKATENNSNLKGVSATKKISTIIDKRDPIQVKSMALINHITLPLMTQIISNFNKDIPDYPFN